MGPRIPQKKAMDQSLAWSHGLVDERARDSFPQGGVDKGGGFV